MNNKAIIEFGFRIIWRIMAISNLHNSSDDTQPHPIIVNNNDNDNNNNNNDNNKNKTLFIDLKKK